ncbi:MAG: lipoyl protein ligase domain-containing protein [Candidatus Helarchaeota archaeon]
MKNQKIRFLELNGLTGIGTQIIYEAVAKAQSEGRVPDTVIICWPEDPLVCIGYHQVVKQEIDVDYCNRNNIPIVRRIIGGGAVYLNKNQIFYQYIFNEGSELLPKTFSRFYELFLSPVVKTYNDFGISAKFRPVNDIEVNNKKISGTGAGTYENSRILTGNFLLDFDFESMIKILKVPDEKFRDKVYKSLKDRLTTMKEELGYIPPISNIIKKFIINLENEFGLKCEKSGLTDLENRILKDLYKKYIDPTWIYLFNESKSDLLNREIKIAKNSGVVQSIYKASGGLIKILIELVNLRIKDILISGDFFIYPENSLRLLENELKGKMFNINELQATIYQFYKNFNIEALGVEPKDFIKAFENIKLGPIID